nr:hypothetical protein BdHM001_18630 [Bdellovibrio sp. HM001]
MTKLEERLKEAAEKHERSMSMLGIDDQSEACKYDFKSGAKFILELPELKALVKSLEFAASEDMWESNQNFDEWFKYKYTKWYQDDINESIDQWRSFIGEESNSSEIPNSSKQICRDCNGNGYTNPPNWTVKCKRCDGKGLL